MVWDGAGITYSELKAMTIDEFAEASAARKLYLEKVKAAQEKH
jgi:hypothetical protein